jgi:deoxyribodipyrimidine photo-lyase
VGQGATCRVVEIESELIVPVEGATLKQEYAARTIRPRIHRNLGQYLVRLPHQPVRVRYKKLAGDRRPKGEELASVEQLMKRLAPAADPGSVSRFHRGGYAHARERLENFRDTSLAVYETQRNEPGSDVASGLSPYLHFGQISSLEIALHLGVDKFVAGLEAGFGRMKNQPGSVGLRVDDEVEASARDAFLEELIVRRGLAHNYVWFARDYETYGALPGWAQQTLADHAGDERPAIYSREQLIGCETHDEHWNDAMREMVVTGMMHNYMRMYWAKKILEWSPSPEEAFTTVLELNNRYFLDGRDPNSYANVAWAFGLHDRPWTERAIFGKVRYMNANGLRRKFDMGEYTLKVRRLSRQAEA